MQSFNKKALIAEFSECFTVINLSTISTFLFCKQNKNKLSLPYIVYWNTVFTT